MNTAGVDISRGKFAYKGANDTVMTLITMYFHDLFPTKYPDYASIFDQDICRHLHCRGCSIYLGFKLETPHEWHKVRKEKDHRKFIRRLFDNFYVNAAYLHVVDYFGRKVKPASESSTILKCRKVRSYNEKFEPQYCDNVIGSSDNVISGEHAWEIPMDGRGIEMAMFFACIEERNVFSNNLRLEELAQGKMFVEDVFCKTCKSCIGWKFSGIHMTCSPWCLSLVGRYGIVKSAVLETIASGDGYTLYAHVECKEPADLLNSWLKKIGKNRYFLADRE